MKFNKLKINGFGKLIDKNIEFDEHINVVKGDNESGKSTLLKFIFCSLYGASKNKNGKDISDFDRYKPWNSEDFSGKIEYENEKRDIYEVYRNFKKKSFEIYENGRDVSDKYNIDKNRGSEFFIEQTGITEEIFLNSFISEQGEVKLSKTGQNAITQKLSNILATGNENISFKKTIEKLNKKQLEEIGTDRSSGRPINIVKEKIEETEEEIKEIEEYKDKKYEIEQEKNGIYEGMENSSNILNLLREVKVIKEKNSINNEKLNILDNEIDGYSEMKKAKEKELEELKKEKNTKVHDSSKIYILYIMLALIIAGCAIGLKNYYILIGEIAVLFLGIYSWISNRKNKKRIKENNRRYNSKVEALEEDLNRLEKIKNLKFNEASKLSDEMELSEQNDKQTIKNKYTGLVSEEKIDAILSTKFEQIVEEISKKEAEVSDYKVSEKRIELTNDDIMKKIEDLVCLEEDLDRLYAEKEELENKNEIYSLVKSTLEEAYEDMKANITPDFILEIQNIISDATNGKYSKCIIEEDGIKVELEDGSYMDIDRLSVGTIDLIYLALRISATKSICEESIPIILDESFAYYDEKRLENILDYLDRKCTNQIIIFSCSDREINALENKRIKYNLISL